MRTLFKIAFSFLVMILIFKLGYEDASDEQGESLMSFPEFQDSPGRPAFSSAKSLLPGQSRYTINGVPAEVDLYTAAEPLAAQAAKFENDWKNRGYRISEQSLGNMKILSAINENTKQFECAMMIPGPNSKQTFVIPARMDLRHSQRPAGSKIPAYPNAQRLLHLESNDLTGNSENLIQLSEASVPAVMSYYKTQLLKEGWQAVESPKLMYDPQFADQVIFERGLEERWVYASKMDGHDQTMIFTLHNQRQR